MAGGRSLNALSLSLRIVFYVSRARSFRLHLPLIRLQDHSKTMRRTPTETSNMKADRCRERASWALRIAYLIPDQVKTSLHVSTPRPLGSGKPSTPPLPSLSLHSLVI